VPGTGPAALRAAAAGRRTARRRASGAAAAGLHGQRVVAVGVGALSAPARLRRRDLGPGPQSGLSDQARQCAGTEDPLPASPDGPQDQPGRLESGRGVRALWRAAGAGMRAQRHHAGQPDQHRPRRQCLAPAGEGDVPADRTSDGPRGAQPAPAGPAPARASDPGAAAELPVLARRRGGAAAGGHRRGRPDAARKHPRAGQPPRSGPQRPGAVDRRRPAGAARGGLAALCSARALGLAVSLADCCAGPGVSARYS